MIDESLFDAAHMRIAPYIRHTPLLPAPSLRGDFHPNLTLKLENLQVTGSFKVYKCKSGKYEECEQYAQGQWDTTINTNAPNIATTKCKTFSTPSIVKSHSIVAISHYLNSPALSGIWAHSSP